ncbi:nucleolar protein 16 [Teleopsis dalmanni]|uniref:nucleolar protein 16 n=1 Tax=Teleopsis dalmanni TaxID=139649 RepID=UPI0018CE0358|nr:nucleolar protein 16 [Teleopsis dalmanni]
MKIKKNHARKHYRYNVNRKTLKKTRTSTGKIKDPWLKKLWEDRKNPNKNFREMGLSSDPNKTVPIPSFKNDRLKIVKIVNGFMEEEIEEEEKPKMKPRRGHVAEKLEEIAKDRGESLLRLPKGVVSQLSYFLDKYQFNYKAMVTDKRNYDQWTWKQFRMKIRKFMSIPEQFNKYLEKKNMKPGEKLPWTEYDSDSEWR